MIMATLVLGLVLDTVFADIAAIAVNDFNVDSGPFGPVLGQTIGIADLMVPILLTGIVLWMIWGAIREERQEEKRTRVRVR